ncbi:beta strand repeat-containing protein [Aromatoleum bremense]|uniref:DUF4214 domain-containing protein n=1 Tax=Aromatoleum bremense TaxID=76115 RepID=A0ABX1NXU5_9RHOO|nr:DUF4214 domain-containing protein [Aromatoleum bremense]NMG16355.1 DUF4214 domain-containing protein [Aromatoleum bremense]QTQ32646.1 putative protein DUf4214 [Aromatoleum bremense]
MAVTTQQQIAAAYVAFFNRAPDLDGLNFWETEAANSGLNDLELMRDIAAGFAQHPSFDSLYGGLGNAAFIDAIYLNIGGAPADANGKAHWLGLIESGELSRSDFVADFVYGLLTITPETLDGLVASGEITEQEKTDALLRQDRLTNKSAVALNFTQEMGDASNLSPGTDPLDPASLAEDPVYQASQAIIAGVTEDDATMDAPNAYLADTPTIEGILAAFGDDAPVAGQTFTLTTGNDLIPGLIGSAGTADTAGDDKVIGNSSTFNPSDAIDAGEGADLLSLVLNEADTTYAGVNVANVEALELRAVASAAGDEVRVSMTDFDSALADLRIVKSTGNIAIEDLQAGIAVTIDDVRGNVDVDFDNQNVPAAVDISVNEFGESAGAVGQPTLSIDEAVGTVNLVDAAAGPAFYNDFALMGGFGTLNVTGGANGTELTTVVESSADTLAADFTGNESDDKNLTVVTPDGQTLTLATGQYDDDVAIEVQGDANLTVELGEGANNLDILGGVVPDGFLGVAAASSIDAVITAGAGDDVVNIEPSAATLDANLGDGNNQLFMGDGSDVNVVTGAGDDYIATDDLGSATFALGEGDNTLVGDDVGSIGVAAGSGNDYVGLGSVGSADIALGDGDNHLDIDSVGSLLFTSGAGQDMVHVYGTVDSANISVGDNDDHVGLYGGNGLEDGFGNAAGHAIAGGDGSDRLIVERLALVDAIGAFANVTSVETLELYGDNGGSLDGVISGANAAGVGTYAFNSNTSGEDIALTNVAHDVTVNMSLVQGDTEGQNFTLTQTPDDGTNTATLGLNLAEFSVGFADTYSFGVITADTTETLNIAAQHTSSGTDDTLDIDNLFSADLTTLNLSGDVSLNFLNVNAPNLELVDATGTTAGVAIALDDVADVVTVEGGSGNDNVVLYDAASRLIADGGAGDDYLEGFGNDDVLRGGEGNDVIDAMGGIDEVYGDAGDDLFNWDAAELSAADLVDGGEGTDTVDLSNSLGVRNDDFFFEWSSVENLNLDAGGNDLTLGAIATAAGLQTLQLSNDGVDGDTITLIEGFASDVAIHLSNGADTIDDTLDAAHAIDLRVFATETQLTAADTLTGGTGNDTLTLTSTFGGAADMTGVTGFENVVIEQGPNGYEWMQLVVGADTVVADGGTLNVDATDQTTWFSFDGSAETTGGGRFNVTVGDHASTIIGGAGDDIITGGHGLFGVEGPTGHDIDGGAGNDTITLGDGSVLDEAATVDAGTGNDTVTTGGGDDVIVGGDGSDLINAGNGANIVTGGLGGDTLTGGTDVDTYVYVSQAESTGLNHDVITNFAGGFGGDVINLQGVLAEAGLAGDIVFLGNFANTTLANTALASGDTNLDAVFVTGEQFVYVDVNDNGVIDDSDMAIELTGVASLTADNFAVPV